MSLIRRRRPDEHVTIESFERYATAQGIPSQIVDENTLQFTASEVGLRKADPVMVPVNVTHQGDGVYSTAAAITPLPSEDSTITSAILRSGLEARGQLQTGPGLLIEGNILAVGSDSTPRTHNDLLHEVHAVAQTAIPVYEAVMRKAVELDYKLDELPAKRFKLEGPGGIA